MTKLIQISLFFILILISNFKVFAQEIKAVDSDFQYKEIIYNKYKKEVLSYDKKKFDELFLEFFTKQNDFKILLSKEEYYTYTIKIAIYSEKLGMLYKSQKQESDNAKKEWFNKNYQHYLDAKK